MEQFKTLYRYELKKSPERSSSRSLWRFFSSLPRSSSSYSLPENPMWMGWPLTPIIICF